MPNERLTRREDELHELAIRGAGFDNFGDPDYREGLRVLLDAYDVDMQLTKPGWNSVYGRVLSILNARLYAQKGWIDHPEVFRIPIHRPLVITGLPRTGSTALHRLLSVDPQFQGLESWLGATPMIRPPRETWETHPVYRAAVASYEAFYARMPEFRNVHDSPAGEVEECAGVLLQNFVSTGWLIHPILPTYAQWFSSQSTRASYRRYVDVLRLVGAAKPDKRWLLKSPNHMAEIDSLLEVFPDVCIIQTHRDPLKVIPSFCSFLHMVGRTLEDSAPRPDMLGPQQCVYWRRALDRMQAAREKYPMNILDVDHRRFLMDPLGTVHSIYEHFGLVLSSHAEQQMLAWISASPTSRHGKHEYCLDSWGVSSALIHDTFADYRALHQFDRKESN